MSNGLPISRRVVLWSGVAAVGAAAVGVGIVNRRGRVRGGARLPEEDVARRIGLEYLQAVPEERDPVVLAALICGDDCRPYPPDARIRQEILRRTRSDYATGNMVQLSGWLLARTEARWWALLALQNGAAVPEAKLSSRSLMRVSQRLQRRLGIGT